MIHLRRIRLTFILQRATSDFAENRPRSSENPLRLVGLSCIVQNPRLYRTEGVVQSSRSKDLEADLAAVGRTIREARQEAKAALLDYLHSTRSIQYLDADNMSRNSPCFLEELLKKVEKQKDIRRSVSRYLRYHPINEFEPFFESIGLKPSEYVSLLPKNLIFLIDDQLLLQNYYALCKFGIPRNKMGKIYKEAPEVFRYDYGVLPSKLKAYEKLGLGQSTLIKVVTSSPYLLIGDCNIDLVKITEKLKHYVNDINWIEGRLLDGTTYNWSQMLDLLCLLGKVLSEQQLADIINQQPNLLFEESGGRTISLICFLVKLGLSTNQVSLVFLEFPQIQVGKFLSNLKNCFLFLSEIDMEAAEIGKIFRSHSLSLGSFTLKRTNSLLSNLNAGKKRLRMVIQDNPLVLKNWARGRRVHPLQNTEEEKSRMRKIEFLLSLGYEEGSKKWKQAFKVFRGKGAELQERFDCIVKAGLDCRDVQGMVKVAPKILNLTTDYINMKIDYLVNELGYPLSTLVSFPSFLSYKRERIELRLSMYKWLLDNGTVIPKLALSTIVACTEKEFVQLYVNQHPSGPEVWQDLKNKISSQN